MKYEIVWLGRGFSGAFDNILHRLLPEQHQGQDYGPVMYSR